MTPVIVKSLLEYEKFFTNNQELKQPLIFILLQEISRFLGSRASSKYDVAKHWRAFCEKHNINFSTVADFKGHRFTILFVIAGTVFFLRGDIIKFYDEYKTQMHDAKIDIGAALKDPLVISQLHLLAATINSLSEHAKSLVEFLEHVLVDPIQFLIGYAPFEHFEEAEEVTARSKAHIAHLDHVKPTYPDIICDSITYVSEDLLGYCKKKFAPFLEGGEYHETTADLRSVPRSNRKCESVFGMLSSDYSAAPNKRNARRDIKVQTKVNQTFNWFKEKSEEERKKIILESMASASKLQEDAAEHEKAFKLALWNKLDEKRENDKIDASIKTRNIQKALNKLQQNGGLWIDEDEMKEHLEPLSAKKLASSSPLFKFSANKVLKNLETLKCNLVSLMTQAAENAEDDSDEDDYDN